MKQNGVGLFGSITLLTLVFLLVEISFLIQSSNAYLGDFRLIANKITIPLEVIPSIVQFVATQLSIHFLFIVGIWVLAYFSGLALHFSRQAFYKWGIAVGSAGLIWVLLLNQKFFPNSNFSHLSEMIFFNSVLLNLSLIIISGFFGCLVLVVMGSVISRYPKTISILLAVLAGFLFFSSSSTVNVPVVVNTEKPNIILIGIDALRPDYVGFFKSERHTPHLDAFLKEAVVFNDAMTPLARTFPAWVSILTGQYPLHHKMRTDLSNQKENVMQRKCFLSNH